MVSQHVPCAWPWALIRSWAVWWRRKRRALVWLFGAGPTMLIVKAARRPSIFGQRPCCVKIGCILPQSSRLNVPLLLVASTEDVSSLAANTGWLALVALDTSLATAQAARTTSLLVGSHPQDVSRESSRSEAAPSRLSVLPALRLTPDRQIANADLQIVWTRPRDLSLYAYIAALVESTKSILQVARHSSNTPTYVLASR